MAIENALQLRVVAVDVFAELVEVELHLADRRGEAALVDILHRRVITVAVDRLKEAGLPYIVVLTNPTTGGVTASYAMLGDIHIAEPGALIGFAGPRVIEQTIREKLPEGFQRSEYLMEHGMVDMVVSRLELRSTIARLLKILLKTPVSDAIEPEIMPPAVVSGEVRPQL